MNMNRSAAGLFPRALGVWTSTAAACAVLVVVGAHTAQAGINVWTSHGPPGGPVPAQVTTVAIDPLTPSTLYAGTDAFGVFKSTDGGAIWANTGLPGSGAIPALAIDPLTPSRLYAVAAGVLFKSTDAGGNWDTTGLTTSSVSIVVIDPLTPTTLYAVTNGGVFKSTDAGDTWSAANTGLPGSVSALAINPHTSSTLYAGTSGGGLFKTTDAGGTWTAANEGLPVNSTIVSLAIDPRTPSTLYSGTSEPHSFQGPPPSGRGAAHGGESPSTSITPSFSCCGGINFPPGGTVYKSTDGGAGWTAAGLPLGSPVLALAVDPRTPRTLYAGTSNGVFKSTNAGGTWTGASMGLLGGAVSALAIDPRTPKTLYTVVGRAFMFKSTDAGGTWTAVDTELPVNSAAFALAIDPVTPTTLYAGAYSPYDRAYSGVFKSTDAGGTWTEANTGLPDLEASALVIDPRTRSTLYAGTHYGVFKSTDAGGTWTAAGMGLPDGAVYALAIAPDTPSTVYAATGACNVPVPQGFGVLPPPCTKSVFNGGTSSNGLFESTDAGGTWTAVSTGLGLPIGVPGLAIDADTPSTLYAVVDGGVLKSTDAGGTWTAASMGLLTGGNVSALAIDPDTPSTLYAGTNAGVSKSTDGGASWSTFGLSNVVVNALALDPLTPTTLYAGTNGGVFDIEQAAADPCVGDCNNDQAVTVDELLTMVNIALGSAQASMCPQGVPSGTAMDISLILQAVNNALSGCGG